MPGERASDLAKGPRRYWGRRGPFLSGTYHPRVTRPPAPSRPIAALLLIGALAASACSATAAGTPTAPGQSTARPTDVASAPPASAEPTPQLPSQSETSWFRIWDAIPDSFPEPIDAAIADPQTGPVSAAWTVPVTAVSAPELAGFYRDAIDELGWAPIVDGPLEDGSFTVYSSDGYGCETLTTILPRGDESLVTVLFGAGCPFR